MASKMPNRYIEREGLIEEEILEAVKLNEVSALQKENRQLKEKLSLQDENGTIPINQSDNFGKRIGELRSREQSAIRPENLLNMLLYLTKQQKEMSKVLEENSGKKFDIVLPFPKS